MREDVHMVIRELAAQYGNCINDTHTAEAFFKDFMKETDGQVIVDFIDEDNWDYIEDVSFDHDKGLMNMVWHSPAKDAISRDMQRMAFGTDYDGLSIMFDSIKIECDPRQEKLCGIFVIGYTDHERQIKDVFKDGINPNDYASNKTEFYSTTHYKRDKGIISELKGIEIPFANFWIFPKGLGMNTRDSREILYLFNLHQLKQKIGRIEKKVKNDVNAAKSSEEWHEAIQNAGNTLRNAGESLLKLYVHLHYKKLVTNPKTKNKAKEKFQEFVMGTLYDMLHKNNVLTDEEKSNWGNFAKEVNNLSHASGIKVEYKKLTDCIQFLKAEIQKFCDVVKNLKNEYLENPDFDNRQSPADYIDDNFKTWNFKKEIESTTAATSGLCGYKLKRDSHFLSIEDVFGDKGLYLCKDGYFKEQKHESPEILMVYDRNELKSLLQSINDNISAKCDTEGFDTSMVYIDLNISVKLERIGKPHNLFTKQQIENLIISADNSVDNQLVIDENGHAHLIHDGSGNLYPVSIECWHANHGYVGPNASPHDIEQGYQLCLVGWLFYLESGHKFYDDVYPYLTQEKMDKIITEICKYY